MDFFLLSFQSENTHLGFHLEEKFLEIHIIEDNTGNVDIHTQPTDI